MTYAMTSLENGFGLGSDHEQTDQRDSPRARVRLAARAETFSRYSFDSSQSEGNDVTEVTVHDLSSGGLLAGDIGDLHVGAVIRLQIPLIGWRNAEIRWIDGDNAGCRFLVPLRDDELRGAIASSPLVSAIFPGLMLHITSPAPTSPAIPPTMVEIGEPATPHMVPERTNDRWPPLLGLLTTAAVATGLWAALYGVLV